MKTITETKKSKINFKIKGSASAIRNQLVDKKKQVKNAGYDRPCIGGGRCCC